LSSSLHLVEISSSGSLGVPLSPLSINGRFFFLWLFSYKGPLIFLPPLAWFFVHDPVSSESIKAGRAGGSRSFTPCSASWHLSYLVFGCFFSSRGHGSVSFRVPNSSLFCATIIFYPIFFFFSFFLCPGRSATLSTFPAPFPYSTFLWFFFFHAGTLAFTPPPTEHPENPRTT